MSSLAVTEVALVVDDMVSFDPFVARGIRIYGRAEPPIRRTGLVGPGYYMPITPTVSWSWNMEAAPIGDRWYDSRRACPLTAALIARERPALTQYADRSIAGHCGRFGSAGGGERRVEGSRGAAQGLCDSQRCSTS